MAAGAFEGAPTRIEGNTQTTEEFSALISLLIPEAEPEPAAAQKTDTEQPDDQPVVFPFPVQAFVPPVEVQPVPEGGQFTVELEAAEAPQTTVPQTGDGEAAPAEAMPAETQDDAPEPVPQSAEPQPRLDVAAPAPAPVPVPQSPKPAEGVPAAKTAPLRSRLRTEPGALANELNTLANESTASEPRALASGNAEAGHDTSETEIAFAVRLTERAAAPESEPAPAPERPVASEPVNPMPAKAPQQAEAKKIVSESIPRERPAEPEKPVAAPKPAVSTPAPAQPARPTAPAAPPERPTAPAPAARADFEPARVEAAPQPVRELSMVVPGQGSGERKPEPVEVKVVERAGQVHVAVRSSDPQLSRSLGENLGELVTKLESRGYATETWRPTAAAVADAPATQQTQPGAGHESFQGSGRGHHGGAGEDSSQQQQRRQDEARPEWLEMLEGAIRRRNTNPFRSTFV
jgi:hypothetical protein